jgi:hypothetical protein
MNQGHLQYYCDCLSLTGGAGLANFIAAIALLAMLAAAVLEAGQIVRMSLLLASASWSSSPLLLREMMTSA